MTLVHANGIEIEYEEHGSREDPTLLMVNGLGSQLIHWPIGMIEALVGQGLHIIRYDNRDVGLSTGYHGVEIPSPQDIIGSLIAGESADVPYTVLDMADDAMALTQVLDLGNVHVLGFSMGGMIAQQIAAQHPDRVKSLISMGSTTGDPSLPKSSEEIMAVLNSLPADESREASISHDLHTMSFWDSKTYPADMNAMAQMYGDAYDRTKTHRGSVRQMAGIMAVGDRSAWLEKITAPTLVIHGTDDPLILPTGGQDTARKIKGAQLKMVEGMAHTLSPGTVKAIVPIIAGHVKAVEVG